VEWRSHGSRDALRCAPTIGRVHTLSISSPVGAMTVVGGERGIRRILWEGDLGHRVQLGEESRPGRHRLVSQTADELGEYFAGERQSFDVPLDPAGTPFQRSVWEALAGIPYGTTRTYGELARSIGRPDAARAVGAANGCNPISIMIPCHRLVGADGTLVGYAGGLDAKRWLLDHEQGGG